MTTLAARISAAALQQGNRRFAAAAPQLCRDTRDRRLASVDRHAPSAAVQSCGTATLLTRSSLLSEIPRRRQSRAPEKKGGGIGEGMMNLPCMPSFRSGTKKCRRDQPPT